MTEQNNQGATANNGGKAYNLKITPIGAVDTTPAGNDTKKIKFRGTYVRGDKTLERTIVAQGKAADLIEGKIVVGEEIGLRCVFKRAPANENGKQGGEFLAVVDLPRAKAA